MNRQALLAGAVGVVLIGAGVWYLGTGTRDSGEPLQTARSATRSESKATGWSVRENTGARDLDTGDDIHAPGAPAGSQLGHRPPPDPAGAGSTVPQGSADSMPNAPAPQNNPAAAAAGEFAGGTAGTHSAAGTNGAGEIDTSGETIHAPGNVAVQDLAGSAAQPSSDIAGGGTGGIADQHSGTANQNGTTRAPHRVIPHRPRMRWPQARYQAPSIRAATTPHLPPTNKSTLGTSIFPARPAPSRFNSIPQILIRKIKTMRISSTSATTSRSPRTCITCVSASPIPRDRCMASAAT